MDLLNLYPPDVARTVVQVLVTVFGPETQGDSLRLANELRAAGIRTEAIMQTNKSLGKQIQYADRKGTPIVAFLGADEIKQRRGEIQAPARRPRGHGAARQRCSHGARDVGVEAGD